MPRGTTHEVFGRLMEDHGCWSLLTDAGGVWRLDPGWRRRSTLRRLATGRVRLLGIRDDFDLLAVKSVDAADGPSAG